MSETTLTQSCNMWRDKASLSQSTLKGRGSWTEQTPTSQQAIKPTSVFQARGLICQLCWCQIYGTSSPLQSKILSCSGAGRMTCQRCIQHTIDFPITPGKAGTSPMCLPRYGGADLSKWCGSEQMEAARGASGCLGNGAWFWHIYWIWVPPPTPCPSA